MEGYNIILKSRQGGMSVCICSLAIHYAMTEKDCVCLLLSHTEESTRAIFNKLKTIYNSLPDAIRPKLVRNNRSELQLKNGSIITCATLGRNDKGRGQTAKLIHLSEFAFVDSEVANKQLLSLEQALRSDGHLIIESTANGLNFFHNHYNKAKNNENTYKSFFYNYIDTKDMFSDEYDKYWEIYKRINKKEFSKKDLTEEEKELLKNYRGMNLKILNWRRLKIKNSTQNQFNQEFPITDDVAFISTGNSVFENEKITKVLRVLNLNKNKYLNKNKLDLPFELLKFYGKSFFMYKNIEVGEKYYIGVDCSEGIGNDNSTCVVLNQNAEEVAMFKNNKIKPYEFAEFVNILGRYFNNAHLVVEKASGGHSVIERLRREYKYLNMAKYRTYDEYNRVQIKVGFDTNNKTKGLMINDFREWFEKGLILINSLNTVEEMKTYEIKQNGSMGAMSGYKDDLVIGTALAIQGIKNKTYYKM